ncbi:winged helix-turn-helix domain-containing protein [Parafrankia irregularis]|uniref:winged helix-turn-helix domain-containing protein n=1 Tax=Parafrankia irregularis TaxID=795642 RepID=UPI001F6077E2|nr:crosslink repair DNA glycosylase YcaQ family protein [Parafrankia irregularis]
MEPVPVVPPGPRAPRVRPEQLSAAQARRLALAVQGFGRPRPTAPPGRRHLRGLLDRVGLLQIDSVNVLARSHYLPGWSRLGPYPRAALDDYVHRERRAFEYWAHEASVVPVAWQPLLRWRAEAALAGVGMWRGVAAFGRERADYVAAALAEVTRRGPITAAELPGPGRGGGSWWGWTDGKRALEYLFWTGQVCAAGRRATFERVYDLPERVLPADVLAVPTPEPAQAHRALLLHAADRLGVATAGDLADYFRLPARLARPRLAELVEAGDLLPVRVEGWSSPAYLRPGLVIPRRVDAAALLSPFDSLIWERSRTRRLFGMEVKLEIYTPAPRRRYGYYVLPFLLGDQLVARVDLKADRAAGVLRVLAAWAHDPTEPAELAAGAPTAAPVVASAPAPPAGGQPSSAVVVEALATELLGMSAWLELGPVEVTARGTLAGPLRRALAASPAARGG